MLKRKGRIKVLFSLVIAALMVVTISIPVMAATTIEDTYKATGALSVSTQVITEGGQNLYKIYYPSTLTGTNSYPIVVWGNGTDATPANYDSFLTNLASWGFVVIDNYDTGTGTGQSILDTANYIVSQNSNAGSIFYQKLNVNKVGAAGHSQGAGGVINAATRYEGGSIFKAVATASLPQLSVCDAEDVYDTSLLEVPVFFFAGTGLLDSVFIAPLASIQAAYNGLQSGLAGAMGRCKSSDHNEIQSTQGGKVGGYLTAWLRYQLMDDTTAAGAFEGQNPEIKTNTGRWQNVATKNMP